MKLFNIFKKRSNKPQNIYTYLGSIGVSPDKLYVYEESTKIIKEFENKYKYL